MAKSKLTPFNPLVLSTTTVSDIATAGSGVSITSGEFHRWGKVAQFALSFKANSAISSGATVCTFVSGKRPVSILTLVESTSGATCTFGTDGVMRVWTNYAVNVTWSIRAIFLLP